MHKNVSTVRIILSSALKNAVLSIGTIAAVAGAIVTALIPPLIVSALLPFAFDRKTAWFTVSEKITWIYFFVALIVSVNAILNTVGDTLRNNDQLKNRPMKGFIQIFQVIFTSLAVIVIISITIGKSPVNLITGLGAFTAVLMLVFKDTIL